MDEKLELMNKNGTSCFVPVSERENQVINSFRKWGKAFRVYSGIYPKANPERANELLQYVSTIKNAAETFVWTDVYAYDQIFRELMEEYPRRNWGIIYQQAWSMLLKETIPKNSAANSRKPPGRSGEWDKEICRKFNKGFCNCSMSCKFDHRCSICNHSGHLMNACYRRKDKDSKDKDKEKERKD